MLKLEEAGNGAVTEIPRLSQEHAKLWEDLRPRLEVYLRSFSGLSFEDRGEILQSAMLKLWRRSARLDADARSWLYGVVRNSAIDVLRSAKRERRRRDAVGAAAAIDANGEMARHSYPGPEKRLLDAEAEAFVADFLAGLEDGDREMLHLAFAEDLSYSSIASLTGRPLGTVKWKIAGLKRRLATRYRKEFE